MTIRARLTDTGFEFDLDADCFVHGSASRRIGLEKDDNPFHMDDHPDRFISWREGWKVTDRILSSEVS